MIDSANRKPGTGSTDQRASVGEDRDRANADARNWRSKALQPLDPPRLKVATTTDEVAPTWSRRGVGGSLREEDFLSVAAGPRLVVDLVSQN